MQVRLFAVPVALDSSGAVATEFCLLKAGRNTYDGGRDEILFDAEAAESCMRVYRARGIDLMADYEHQSLTRPPVKAPASAKRWVPEIRNGELWASSIQWTDAARQHIEAGEYRYWSIACRVDPKTNRCVQVINFALTNTPAADGIAALVAASLELEHTTEGYPMKTVLVALGLSAEAEESAGVARASRLLDLEREVLALAQKSSVSEALGALRAMSASHAQVAVLTERVKAIETEKRGVEFDALVKKGLDARQLTPALAQGDWIKSLRGREDGVVQLTSYLASAPAIVAGSEEAPIETKATSPEPELTEADIKIARQFTGGDEEALQKRLDALRDLRRTEMKRKAAA